MSNIPIIAAINKIGIKSESQWRKFKSGDLIDFPSFPENIPRAPDYYYGQTNEWVDWYDFLGKKKSTLLRRYKSLYVDYEDARFIVRKYKFQSKKDFLNRFYQLSKDLKNKALIKTPSSPESYYRRQGGWISWSDYLGFKPKKVYKKMPYVDAKSFAISLKLKSSNDFRSYKKGKYADKPSMPHDFPRDPYSVYKLSGDWESWSEFLGTHRQGGKTKNIWLPFKKVRDIAIKNLKNSKNAEQDWYIFCKKNKGKEFFKNIPVGVRRVYKSEWVSWKHFVGRDD